MKRYLLLIFMLLTFIGVFAQSIAVKSFNPLPMDKTASSHEGKRIDQNGQVAALIKVVTTQTGFTFEGGTLGIVDTKQHNGEIWVWVPRASRKITILHQQLGVLRDYRYPIEIEAECTYEMVLTTVAMEAVIKEKSGQQYLIFELEPKNASLEVDEKLWSVDADGAAFQFVDFGTYTYRVRAANYITDTGVVTVDDADNPKTVKVTLKPDFVEVSLKVDADAEIWVNNEKKGTRTWTGPLGKGIYKIECKQEGHETTMISKEITTEMNGQTITLPVPTPIYGSLNVESTPIGATIYIDGKEVGKTPKFINGIQIGQHEIKLTKDDYFDFFVVIIVEKDDRIQVNPILEKQNAQKMCEIGDDYYFGANGERDFSKAVYWYRKAADLGYPVAQYSLGQCYLLGQGIERDNSEALKWIKRAAEQDIVIAQESMGEFYFIGLAGLTQNYAEAFRWYNMAAKNESPRSQYFLGLFYFYGYGVPVNESEAVKWWRKSANQGYAGAQSFLGSCYIWGSGVISDYHEANKWFRKAAEQGDANAQYGLGCSYSNGYGVNIDHIEATKYFRMAAEQGHASAQFNLGNAYYNGRGVEKNYYEAVNWFQKAAEQGDEKAQCNLGLCYYYGHGVSKNYSEASKWLHKAAENGDEYSKILIKDLNL